MSIEASIISGNPLMKKEKEKKKIRVGGPGTLVTHCLFISLKKTVRMLVNL